MATFSSWTSLLATLKNDLASGSWAHKSYRRPDGTSVEYREIGDLLTFYAFVSEQAANEAATTGVATRRTSTRFVSGGSW